MIPVPSGVRVWIAAGATDMRRGMNGLALQIQETLQRDSHAGDIFAFRGRRGDLIKILWHDGLGLSLYAKRLDEDASSGPRRRTVRLSSLRGSSAICLKESTGVIRSERGGRKRPDDAAA